MTDRNALADEAKRLAKLVWMSHAGSRGGNYDALVAAIDVLRDAGPACAMEPVAMLVACGPTDRIVVALDDNVFQALPAGTRFYTATPALASSAQPAEPGVCIDDVRCNIDYNALIAAAFERHKYRPGTGPCVAFARGAEWAVEQKLAAQPAEPGVTGLRIIFDEDAIQRELEARQFPSNPRNAARAGWEAAVKHLAASGRAEPGVTGDGIKPCCQEWESCKTRCVPRAEHWKAIEASGRDEATDAQWLAGYTAGQASMKFTPQQEEAMRIIERVAKAFTPSAGTGAQPKGGA